MMTKLTEFLRFFFVSPEFALLLAGLFVEFHFRTHLNEFLAGVNPSAELIKHLSLLPAAAAGWVIFSGRKLLFPDRDAGQWLQQWPDYWRLRLGFDAAILHSIIFASMGLVAWALDWSGNRSLPYTLLATALLGGGFAFFSVYRAQQIVDEIIAQEGREH